MDDERIVALALAAERIGIDAPFGWPDAFVAAISAYRDGLPWPELEGKELRFRATDRFVWETVGRPPLSVSSDRIALCTMRAARLFARLGEGGERVDRSGRGRVVEVYPAAALRRWRLEREDTLRIPWLALEPEVRQACEASRDVADALVAALVARAASRQLCEPIPPEAENAAAREGWIALPLEESLDRLP